MTQYAVTTRHVARHGGPVPAADLLQALRDVARAVPRVGERRGRHHEPMQDGRQVQVRGDVGRRRAARRAQATAVAVTVEVAGEAPEGTVAVLVDHDGVGLPPVRDRRSGTENLAARARRHRSTFALAASPRGHGTRPRWWAPRPAS